MDRLAIYMAWIAGVSIAGAMLIVAFTLGYYTLWTFAICGGAGLILAYPVGYAISRWVKKEDPEWNPKRKPSDYDLTEKPKAPEV
jgi:hypothetical protein